MPFETPTLRAEKFKAHRAEFSPPPADDQEYEAWADAFLLGARAANTFECRRKSGRVLRYNTATDEFGVLSIDGKVVTYFKADPAVHGEVNNWTYFRKACRR